jgi:hypothetical protein
MSEGRRVDAFVAHPQLREQKLVAPKDVPAWAMIALAALGVVVLIFLVSRNHPTVYGFAVCMVVAVVAERASDGLGASRGGLLLVAEVERSRLWFRVRGGGVALASVFVSAVVGASVFFVAAMITPNLDLNRFFSAFGLLLAWGCWHGAQMLWRAARSVELRLDTEGISASLWGRLRTTVPWNAVIGAHSERRSLVLTTTSGTITWPAQQFLSDPVVIAEAIDRFCASDRRGPFAESIVEELITPGHPAR